MPKVRKRDGVYWRKDCRKYWLSYVDENGNRKREPASENWGEAQDMLRNKIGVVKDRKNLKPGEVPACRETFADVADLPESSAYPEGIRTRSRNRGSFQGFLHRQAR